MLPLGALRTLLAYSERALIDKFTCMWSLSRSMEVWIEKTWKPMMKGNIALNAVGNDIFSFLFEPKEDRDMIF